MTRLYLIRHGETLWNKEKRAQGAQDIKLSENGKIQGKLLADSLKDKNIDLIYASDLSRAYETAELIGKSVEKPVTILEGIREINFGKWEGLTRDEMNNKYKEIFEEWNLRPHLAKIPGGETLKQVQKRAMEAVNGIIEKNPGKNIVMVSHGVSIKAIIFDLLNIELSNYKKFRQDNTAVNIIDIKKPYNVLVQLNDTCHLKDL